MNPPSLNDIGNAGAGAATGIGKEAGAGAEAGAEIKLPGLLRGDSVASTRLIAACLLSGVENASAINGESFLAALPIASPMGFPVDPCAPVIRGPSDATSGGGAVLAGCGTLVELNVRLLLPVRSLPLVAVLPVRGVIPRGGLREPYALV
tara:strand:+ start:148 stop:597 length:450 start_codon:yes stop_codon:yes gene_type:complete